MAKAATKSKPNQEIAISEARIPYVDGSEPAFGIDPGGWKVLVESIFPAAKTSDSVVMALNYCKARNLDPFKRPVHIVPMWSSAKGGMVETVWPGISELRTTAFRTGEYAGCDEAEFGEDVTEEFVGRVKGKDGWEDTKTVVTYPNWCRITVHRAVKGTICKFVGPKVYWLETYGGKSGSKIPNDMWEHRASGQLEKCAEAAALRKAFPEELGNILTAEEMEGRGIDAEPLKDITPPPDRPTRKPVTNASHVTEGGDATAAEGDAALDAAFAGTVGPKPAPETPQFRPASENHMPPIKVPPQDEQRKHVIALYDVNGEYESFEGLNAYFNAFNDAIRENRTVLRVPANVAVLEKLLEKSPKLQTRIDELESIATEDGEGPE